MSYLQFHFLFLLPPLLLLLPGGLLAVGVLGPRAAWTLPAVAALAVLYTLPWDAHLIASGVWWYGADRVLGTVWGIPVEEVAFFVLQPILTGLVLYRLLLWQATSPRTLPATPAGRADAAERGLRWIPTLAWLALAAVGALLLRREAGTYMGLILVWAAPVIAAQWAFATRTIAAHGGVALLAVALPTLYLWAADRAAIALGIWHISEAHTLGFDLLGLPLEEAVFFLLTNVLVVQGALLFLAPDLPPLGGPASHGRTGER